MARKPKTKRRRRKTSQPSWWRRLDYEKRRRLILGGMVPLLLLAGVFATTAAVGRMQLHVEQMLVERFTPTLSLIDLPPDLADLAEQDLRDGVADLLEGDWTDDQLCREMAANLARVGWVRKVHFVRRSAEGCFEASCRYRRPYAMVQQESEFLLVDRAGVRLPGVYRYDPGWQLVQGVAKSAPSPGMKWAGDDLQAGLAVIEAVEPEPFADQITAVLVGNYAGRADPRRGHLELATDRAGGRIRWGSAPGDELEENVVGQKLAILRENHRRTGRVDAGHPVIDVSTFPDRFTIPG